MKALITITGAGLLLAALSSSLQPGQGSNGALAPEHVAAPDTSRAASAAPPTTHDLHAVARPAVGWSEYLPQADQDQSVAVAFIARGGLDHVPAEHGRAICRRALEHTLAQLGSASAETVRESAISGDRETFMLSRTLQSGRFSGYSQEVLDTIREAYVPSLETAADEYVAALDGAIQSLWTHHGELAWHVDEVDPGLGDREGKPAYTRVTRTGPWCFRLVVWREDHPGLLQAHERLNSVRQAALEHQLDYLTSLE